MKKCETFGCERKIEDHFKTCSMTCGYDEYSIQDSILKTKAVLEYCEKHIETMWAARVCGILLGCDFRDVKYHIESFYEYCENKGL